METTKDSNVIKAIIPVPVTTLPYHCGERFMTCELKFVSKKHFEHIQSFEFFKDLNTALEYNREHDNEFRLMLDMKFTKG